MSLIESSFLSILQHYSCERGKNNKSTVFSDELPLPATFKISSSFSAGENALRIFENICRFIVQLSPWCNILTLNVIRPEVMTIYFVAKSINMF